MEALRRTFTQYLDLYKSMSPSQRGTLIVVPLMIVAAFGFLMFSDRSSSYVALSWGKAFTYEELMSAQTALTAAGLNDSRQDGQKLMAPRGEIERYNAALLEGGSLPTDWASELQKQIEKRSLFTSGDELQAMKDIALGKALRRMIRAVPDIEDGSVIWARSKRRRHGIRPKVTATVYVRPRRGHELSMQLVHSLRAAVANSVPDLKTADVVVFNQLDGTSFTPNKDGDPFDNRLLTRIREFEQMYQHRVSEALSYIPGVLVTVNVDLDNLKSSVVQEQIVDPKKVVPVQQTEQSKQETYRQQSPRAEPGVKSNRARELNTQGGEEKSRSIIETNSSSVTASSFTKSVQEIIGAMPKAVQVSVQIPEDYYRAMALKRGLTEGQSEEEKKKFDAAVAAIEEQVQKDVRATVATNIPAGSPAEAINVISIVPIDPEVPDVDVPLTETVGNAFSRWGGALGLGLFALWALWMLNKSISRRPAKESTPAAALGLHTPADEESEENELISEAAQRDKLQSMVRDNPGMTASVLGKWIEAEKQVDQGGEVEGSV